MNDLIGVVQEAEKAARQDGNSARLGDLDRMKAILLEAKRSIEKVQKEAGKRGNA